jgi:hypothetical protein
MFLAPPTSALLPWFPEPRKWNKEIATRILFSILDEDVEKRKWASVPTSDAMTLCYNKDYATQ